MTCRYYNEQTDECQLIDITSDFYDEEDDPTNSRMGDCMDPHDILCSHFSDETTGDD